MRGARERGTHEGGWACERGDSASKPQRDPALKGMSTLEGMSKKALKGMSKEALKGMSKEALKGMSMEALKGMSTLEGMSKKALKGMSMEALKGMSTLEGMSKEWRKNKVGGGAEGGGKGRNGREEWDQ